MYILFHHCAATYYHLGVKTEHVYLNKGTEETKFASKIRLL
jgi:hypothetical protein